jgi:hypothetical protein
MEYREEMGKLNIQRIDKIERTVDNIRNALSVLHNRLETTRNFISAKHDDFSITKRL